MKSLFEAFEEAHPELYYSVGKGKICAGEPLYGAIITTFTGEEISHGECEASAEEALRIAINNAGLAIPASRPAQAVADVIAERRRQIEVEDFDACHDDMATRGQLATAAACYAFQAGARGRDFPSDHEPIGIWPWSREWWKPADPRRNLIKAAALIIAEIERLDRLDSARNENGDNQ